MGQVNQLLDRAQAVRGKTHFGEIEQPVFFFEQPEDDPFAVRCGQHRHTEIDILARGPDGEATVLREPFFRDVQSRHDFQTGDDARLKMLGRGENGVEHAVDTIADDQASFERFEVDVTGALTDGLKEDRVDQPDDRRFIGGIQQILRLIQFMCDLAQILTGRNVLHDLFGSCGTRGLVVGPIEARHQRHRRSQDGFDRHAEEQAQVVKGRGLQGIRGGDDDRSVIDFHGQHPVAAREMNRHFLDQFMIDLRHVEMRQPGHLELHRERLKQQILFDGPDLEQRLAKASALGLLEVQGLEQLGFRKPEFLFEDGSE